MTVTVKDGKFTKRVNSDRGKPGGIRGSISETGAVRGYFTGLGWTGGSSSFRLSLDENKGSNTAETSTCGTHEFTMTRLTK